jgi:DNA-binding transcriptional LysR family regulator
MPETDIRVTTQTSLMKVHPAEADLSILLGEADDWPDLVTYPLFTRRLVVAAAPSLLSGFNRKQYDSLDGKTLIVHENRPNAWANWSKALNAPAPRAGKILRFDSMSTVVQAAARGLGFAIVSWPLSERWFDSGELVRVFDTEWITDEYFFLAHRPAEQNRPDISQAVDWLLQELARDK